MKHVITIAVILILCGACTNNRINHSRALFEYLPDDPQLLALVRPNELMSFTHKTVAEMGITDFVDEKWGVEVGDFERYRTMAVEIFEAVGLPWSDIEAVGVLIYFEKPIILATGAINKDEVTARILELGFTQNSSGTINYIYDQQKLLIPQDGLIMMAEESLLDFMTGIPPENRLWNRDDFAQYRVRSPIDNTIFIWSDPPDSFLKSFTHRDALGSVSLAIDLKKAITVKNSIRLKDPQKTVLLYDILFGGVSIARGVFGEDPVYGPLFRGIDVNQDTNQVTTSLVIPPEQVDIVRNRLIEDIENPGGKTFDGIRQFIDTFK